MDLFTNHGTEQRIMLGKDERVEEVPVVDVEHILEEDTHILYLTYQPPIGRERRIILRLNSSKYKELLRQYNISDPHSLTEKRIAIVYQREDLNPEKLEGIIADN